MVAYQEFNALDLTPLQMKIYNACELDSLYQYIVVVTGRQSGKTECTIQICLNWCLGTDNFKVGYFEPIYKQARKVFKQFKKGLVDLEKCGYVTFNTSELTVTFANGSTIHFFSAETDSCRGFTFQGLICDEAGFIKDDIFNSAILPTVLIALSANRGKVLLTSTPKRKNYFYTYYGAQLERKISIKATSEEAGLIDKNALEQLKATTPPHIYANEYMAEFMDAGGGIFPYVNCISDIPFTDFTGCVAGIDFGVENDYTVLAIMNMKGQLVHLERWNKDSWTPILRAVAARLKQFKVMTAYAETNGIGNMPHDTLKNMMKSVTNVIGWVTSNKSKVDIINKLSADFQQGLIEIPDIDYLKLELDAFELQYTQKTGKVTYGARSGFHDDSVMALAIANFNRMTNAKRFEGPLKLTGNKWQQN